MNIVEFIKSVGGKSMDIVKSPKTGSRFFVIPGTDEQGRISRSVKALSTDLEVSWFAPEDAESEEEYSWIVHPARPRTNVVDSFSID